MNFRYKCAMQRFFSILPYGEQLNYLMQRYVTRTLPSSESKFLERYQTAKSHFDIYKQYGETEIENASCYEFGAGWDLLFPLTFSHLGFKRIHCVDIRYLVKPLLINHNLGYLRKIGEGGGANKRVNWRNCLQSLQDDYRIDYRAPMDARCTDIPANSIDFFYSNVTFEHIPADVLPAILKECNRIMTPNGVASIIIDYKDHWSYFDKSISVYNYLKFTDSGAEQRTQKDDTDKQ
ncbi:hypothetical protein FACS189443_5720 [Planctomycetales bacterium]|nr:hypothetical protein FACS189443_5720 [Planctomycetales bacterium]